jgi:hypothetical protein
MKKLLITILALSLIWVGTSYAFFHSKIVELNCSFKNGYVKNLPNLDDQRGIQFLFPSYTKDIYLKIDLNKKSILENTQLDISFPKMNTSMGILDNEITFSYYKIGNFRSTLTYTLDRVSGGLNEVRIMEDINTVMYRNWQCLSGKKFL